MHKVIKTNGTNTSESDAGVIQMNTNVETLQKITKILVILNKLRDRLTIVFLIIGLSLLLYVLLNEYFNVTALYKNILEKVSTPTGLWTTVGLVFLIGIFLSIFKAKQQFWYGVFETVFALLSCYFAIKNIGASSQMLSIFVALGSSIYLIVRGLSNILDGSKKPFWTKKEITEVSDTINSVSTKSMTNLLKDKKSLVNVLLRVSSFILRII